MEPLSPNRSADLPACGTDQARLDVLHSYGILDTPAEAQFDEITALVAHVCEAPIAIISLIDANRQWFKSEIGLALRETPLDHSICAHAILQEDLFIVADTTKDARFASTPLVMAENGLRFYAGAPLKSPEGKILGTLCVLDRKPRLLTEHQKGTIQLLARHVMSIFELRRQTRLLEEAHAREEQASKAKDHFLGLLSHELRTPLTPILLSTSVLLGDSSLDPTQRESVKMIERGVKLQVRLIDDLLDYTRLEQKRIRLDNKPVDLVEVLRDTVKSFNHQPEMPAIKWQLSARQTSVNGDRARLKQIFWNILHNAIKFTAMTGHVAVEVADLTADTVRVGISDSGIGISPTTLPRIFEPFEQGEDYPASKRVAGLGLGLALVKGLVILHGGEIRASSGGYLMGASFEIDLPSIKTVPVQEITTIGQPHMSPVSLRILLVEDQAATAVSLTRLLFRAGHRVLAAGSLAAAKDIAARENFDVLVSDIGLPDGSGYELMSNLRNHGFSHGIALSGHGSDEDLAASLAAGFEQHLIKPVDYSEVESALNRVAIQITRSGAKT